MRTDTIKLIYAGGTFGCHGKPLMPLDADVFLPHLSTHLNEANYAIDILDNDLTKDSSQLTLKDFFYFYRLLLRYYHLGYRRFIFITGTDTLSYLASFFAECFAGSDILIAVTASMKPLFFPEKARLQIDQASDAWGNLQGAIEYCDESRSGVYVCLAGHDWFAENIKKQHSHAINAFIQQDILSKNSTLMSSYSRLNESQRMVWAKNRLEQLIFLENNLSDLAVFSVFVMPSDLQSLNQQLVDLLAQKKQVAVILLGLGAGNLPYSQKLAETLEQACQDGHLIVASTQCPFGGVSASYASGNWQYEHQVLSGEHLSVETIFSRLLWLYMNPYSADERRALWLKWLA